VPIIGLKGTPFSWIFKSQLNLRGFEPCGWNCQQTSSERGRSLRRTVIPSTLNEVLIQLRISLVFQEGGHLEITVY
jgi:hypothetical protein